ncbi:hypothetical protein HAX54_004097 [Datura stramonium]|uniref:Uncharacterized protein n=1 Tax=Datura stramonium TaxID=4076 RepID=A0ABS8T6G3_DATST|nr:hypothetical protein [Datura stramonium]
MKQEERRSRAWITTCQFFHLKHVDPVTLSGPPPSPLLHSAFPKYNLKVYEYSYKYIDIPQNIASIFYDLIFRMHSGITAGKLIGLNIANASDVSGPSAVLIPLISSSSSSSYL